MSDVTVDAMSALDARLVLARTAKKAIRVSRQSDGNWLDTVAPEG